MTRTRPAFKAAAIALGAGLLVVACGSGSGSSTATSAPAASVAAAPSAGASTALCADAAALRSSVGSLTHIKVGKVSVTQIKSDAAKIKSGVANAEAKLTVFSAQAKTEFHAETSALKSALANLHTAASNLASHPGLSTVPGVVTAVGGVTTAAGSLRAAVGTKCA